MSEKTIPFAAADTFSARLEMRMGDGSALEARRHASRNIAPIHKGPYAETFSLYPLVNESRGAGISAGIRYSLYAQ